MADEELVSVYTVKSPTEAELVRNALKSVGIPCEIGGEGQAGFSGVFEIDILTPASEVDAARKYLRKLRREKQQRRKQRREAKSAKEAKTDVSEAIQEKPPRQKPPGTKK